MNKRVQPGSHEGKPSQSDCHATSQPPSRAPGWWRWLRWSGLSLLVVGLVGGLGWLSLAPKTASCYRTKSNKIGAHRCRGCHQAAYKTWAASAHARAFALLPPKQRNNTSCLRCHSTGRASHLQGVQCESCHGGGRHYVRPEVMIDPLLARTVGLRVTKGAAGCTSCHTPRANKAAFRYTKQWAKIAHGTK